MDELNVNLDDFEQRIQQMHMALMSFLSNSKEEEEKEEQYEKELLEAR